MQNDDNKKQNRFENFALDGEGLTPTGSNSYDDSFYYWSQKTTDRLYTLEEATRIIEKGTLEEKKKMSRIFFESNGFYRQFIMLMSAILNFSGLLIPIPALGQSLQKAPITKKYNRAVTYADSKMNIRAISRQIVLNTMIDGRSYWVINNMDKNDFCMMELPYDYCRTVLKDSYGRYVVDFDVGYFDKEIKTEAGKKLALKAFPKQIADYYKKWAKRKNSEMTSWCRLEMGVGWCFELFTANPMFLSIIPSIMQQGSSIENELTREVEEIKKLLVIEMEHLNDGSFVIEPEEAQEMHNGVSNMLRNKNPNTSVLTTYGKANLYTTKSSDAATKGTMETMIQNIYSNAGASSQIFSSTNSGTLKSSINFNISIIMVLVEKIETCIGEVINSIFGDKSIRFRYMFLPVGILNKEEYITRTLKMASSGYSFLLPAIAEGFSQEEIGCLKDLENNIIGLNEKLIPLGNSYTQSNGAKESESPTDGKTGRPEALDDKQSDKTIQNKESKENAGD